MSLTQGDSHTNTARMVTSSKLFQPMRIGNIELSNRIVLAPLTRYRADDSHVPLPFVADYYAQRASYPGTLLITEGTFISPQAGGYTNVPGIYNVAQIEAWKNVTAAVHAKNSFIFMQLWALGRTADPSVLKQELGEKGKVVSASNIPLEDGATPEALTEEEIWDFIGYFKQAAKNAIEAGFDGVEIHGANGYLVDQFVQDVSNHRTDGWGGNVRKRARFGLEVAKAVVEAVGAERTAMRMSPFSDFQGMKMDDPKPQFTYYAEQLRDLNLAYLHIVVRPVTQDNVDTPRIDNIDFLMDTWKNISPVLIAGGYKTDLAYKAVDEEHQGKDVAVAFGRYFISNPDLVFRIKERLEFTPYDRRLFYNKAEAKGYTTWEFSKEWEAQVQRNLRVSAKA